MRAASLLGSWRREVERTRAAEEMERLASMAATSSSQADEARELAAQAARDKAELETHNKKLKALLAKARQQMTDQRQAKDQMPDNFVPEDVVRRTRGPDGATWCLIASKRSTRGEASTFEWREEAAVLAWFGDEDGQRRALARFAPLLEEHLSDLHSRAVREVEARMAVAQQEAEAVNERFAQYQRRAELALNMAEQPREADERSEKLKEELARLARDRNVHMERVEELLGKLNAADAAVSALRVAQQQASVERDSALQQLAALEAALVEIRRRHAAEVAGVEREASVRVQSEKQLRHEAELKLSEAQRAVARLTAEEMGKTEALKVVEARLDKLVDENERLSAALRARDRVAEAASTAHAAAPTAAASPALNASTFDLPRDPAPSAPSTAPTMSTTPATPRRSLLGSDVDLDATPDAGSRFFVEQIQGLRAARRQERTEFQRELETQSAKLAEAVRAKTELQGKLTTMEQKLSDAALAEERRALLGKDEGLTYLKNAVLRFMTADDDSERETLLPVIATLLKFSKDETAMLARPVPDKKQSGGLFGLFSS